MEWLTHKVIVYELQIMVFMAPMPIFYLLLQKKADTIDLQNLSIQFTQFQILWPWQKILTIAKKE